MLNTEEETECWGRYKRKFAERHGDGTDPMCSPVDSLALYDSNSRKPRGKWRLFNGIVSNKEALAEVKSGSSSSTLKRQRREAADHQRREESEKFQLHNVYTQKMAQWSTKVYKSYALGHKLLETIARDQGYPSADIPPPLSPPPKPPTTRVIDLDNSWESDMGDKNGDDNFNVIAHGMLAGYLSNSSTSGAVNFLPPLDELDPF